MSNSDDNAGHIFAPAGVVVSDTGAGEQTDQEKGDVVAKEVGFALPVKSNRKNPVWHLPSKIVRLFSPSRQRQKWGSNQVLPHVNWGDTFFDLFYVAGFYNMGAILKADPSPIGLLYFCGTFFPMLDLWQKKMMFDSRFVVGGDIFHKVYEVADLLALAFAVSSIQDVSVMSNPSKREEMFTFAIAMAVAYVLLCLRYAECYLCGRGQRKIIKRVSKNEVLFKVPTTLFSLAAAVLAGIAFYNYDGDDEKNDYDENDVDEEKRILAATGADSSCDESNKTHLPIVLMLLGFVTNQLLYVVRFWCFAPKNGDHKKISIPMNIDYVIHRYGEWTMLVLGESVLSLLIVDVETDRDYYIVFVFGVLTVILLQLLDFLSQAHDANDHAMRRDKYAGILFNFVMSVYSAALVAVGACYKVLLYSLKSDDKGRRLYSLSHPFDDQQHRWLAETDSACGLSSDERKQNVAHMFSFSLTILFVCLDVLILAHVGMEKGLNRCKPQESVCIQTGATKKSFNLKAFGYVIFRVAITAFIVTLSQWVVEPKYLALAGFAAVVCQIANRFLGDMLFNYRVDGHSGHQNHHHKEMSDDEDDLFDKGDEALSDDDED